MIKQYFIQILMKEKIKYIVDVRGIGLMIGVELNIDGKTIYQKCFDHGLIINCTQGNVLRIMPALNVTKKQADRGLYILEKTLKTIDEVKK